MGKTTYKFKAKTRDYGRDPETPGWTKLANKLESVGGWRLRSELDNVLEAARTDLGAACSHIERKDWPNAIVCIEDALKGGTELRRILNSFRESAPVKPLICK
jgi:hypothetical protein